MPVGAYDRYSKDVDFGAPPHTNSVAARATVANIALAERLVAQVSPQACFLRTNGQNGIYFNASAFAGLRDSPLSVGTMLNIPVRTSVVVGGDVLWNVSFNYAFR